MSASTRSIDALLREINDEALRGQLQNAINALRKQIPFGLVFEGHHPEVSQLPGLPIKPNGLVTARNGKGEHLLRVVSVRDGVATCYDLGSEASAERNADAINLSELVACKRFGDPIFPSLKIVDEVACGGDKPWHLLVEADNFHALQLLRYTHLGRIDVIYIDPPYNTGARDWKYNNDYVDRNDPWRHSKWLSFMEKRLRLAYDLLSPDGVLVVTIDEHEVHHLSCLLEQTLPDAYQQMVTIVINPAGVTQGRFSRVEEHALFCFKGNGKVSPGVDDFLTTLGPNLASEKAPQWESLLRRGTGARRTDRKSMFYPVAVDPENGKVVRVGEPLPIEQAPDFDMRIDGFPVAWPVRTDLSLGRWKVGADTLRTMLNEGFVKLGRYDAARRTWGITYVTRKIRHQLSNGEIISKGRHPITGVTELVYKNEQTRPPRTVWNRTLHNAGPHGTDFLRMVFGEGEKFTFPKSIYSVRDTLSVLVRDKPRATVLDFFAGSGTTYNAVALLNASDGGSRQCILVSNNEVSEEAAKKLTNQGHGPGDPAWEREGVCQAVTWPRMSYVTTGRRSDGTLLPGEYFTGDYDTNELAADVFQIELDGASLSTRQRRDLVRIVPGLPMSAVQPNQGFIVAEGNPTTVLWDTAHLEDWLGQLEQSDGIARAYVFTRDKHRFAEIAAMAGDVLPPFTAVIERRRPLRQGFEENLAYLRLGFLDADEIIKGKRLRDLVPVLWLLTGAKGKCPSINEEDSWIVSQDNKLAILLKERKFLQFRDEIRDKEIENVFLITDALDAFQDMVSHLAPGTNASMLYNSFVMHFVSSASRVF